MREETETLVLRGMVLLLEREVGKTRSDLEGRRAYIVNYLSGPLGARSEEIEDDVEVRRLSRRLRCLSEVIAGLEDELRR